MASLATTGSSMLNSASKNIPLLCCVCPDTPRFSDVSHLLTHIASKGHLHHETQTKLRSHQNIAASVALQDYERWYRDHGIEALLVDRLKAKQVKEAARQKRTRALPQSPPNSKLKKRMNQGSVASPLKEEPGYPSVGLPIFPGLYAQGQMNSPIPSELQNGSDMLSLKGQVWPGMGKMDLANEEMKRTRNQRKPKSAIEKMRRTSEGIGSEQVIMSSNFEFERVKDVYDEASSPIPDQEDPTPPRKSTKPKRKRNEPLAEISANIPRGGNSRGTSNNARGMKRAKSNLEGENSSRFTGSLAPLRQSHDIFRDDDSCSAFDERSSLTPSEHSQRFELRDRFGMPQLNPISQSNLVSPTPNARDLPSRGLLRGRVNAGSSVGQNGHTSLGQLHYQNSDYQFNEVPSSFGHSARMPIGGGASFSGMPQEHYQVSAADHPQTKPEAHESLGSLDHLSRSLGTQFLSMPGANPLFTQDRGLSPAYNSNRPMPSLPSLGFTPINQTRDSTDHSEHGGRDRTDSEQIKLESHPNRASGDSYGQKDGVFGHGDIWESQAPCGEFDIHDELDTDHFRV